MAHLSRNDAFVSAIEPLIEELSKVCGRLPDPRKRPFGPDTCAMSDIGLASFSACFLGSPSSLARQAAVASGQGRSNCRTLFGADRAVRAGGCRARPGRRSGCLAARPDLILPPQLDRLVAGTGRNGGTDQCGEGFLCAARSSTSAFGLRGRTATWPNPGVLTMRPALRSSSVTNIRSNRRRRRSERRRRTTPSSASSGPCRTQSASCIFSPAAGRAGVPPQSARADRLAMPSSLQRITQSPRVCRSMPQRRAASARVLPSSTKASAGRRAAVLPSDARAAARSAGASWSWRVIFVVLAAPGNGDGLLKITSP